MEDFVTFEIAKKLKEKGFPQHWSDQHYILENEYEDDFFEVGAKYPVDVIYDYIPTIASPTISQVLKWLREEKKIHIVIDITNYGFISSIISFKWYKSYCENEIENYDHKGYSTYEQAAIASIEYCLDNLI